MRRMWMMAAVLLATGCGHDHRAAPSPSQPTRTADGREQVTVLMSDFEFTPATITLAQNRPVRLELVNRGSGKHDLTAPRFFRTVESSRALPADGKIVLARGETATLDLVPKEKGTFPYECSVFLHSLFGMTGQFVVE
jgi:uncharacterized cupredoxin-like copper-binding protein